MAFGLLDVMAAILAKLATIKQMGRIRSAYLTADPHDWIGEPAQVREGYPVLIKFWDSTCINCLRSLPWVAELHELYRSRGLRIIGVHTPEFSFAAEEAYVRWRVKQLRLPFPVLIDSQRKNWENFANRYWPSYWLIDAKGYVTGEWIGEGREREIEETVRALIEAESDVLAIDRVSLVEPSCLATIEWFGGFRGWENGQVANAPEVTEEEVYLAGGEPNGEGYALSGRWQADRESWIARSALARLSIRPSLKKLGVVAGGGKLAWTAALQPREEIIAERPQFIDLGSVVPGDLITLELEPHKTRLYSIVESF